MTSPTYRHSVVHTSGRQTVHFILGNNDNILLTMHNHVRISKSAGNGDGVYNLYNSIFPDLHIHVEGGAGISTSSLHMSGAASSRNDTSCRLIYSFLESIDPSAFCYTKHDVIHLCRCGSIGNDPSSHRRSDTVSW